MSVESWGSVVEDVLAAHLELLAPEGADVRWLAEAGICWEPGPGRVEPGDARCGAESDGTGAGGAGSQDAAARLRAALAGVGLEAGAVEMFAVAAQAAGALARGEDLSAVTGRTTTSATASGDEADGEAGDDAGGGAGDLARGECSVGAPDLQARTVAASGVLDLVGALTGLSAHLDATLVGVVSDLSVRNGRILLARRGVTDPVELSAAQARRWRSGTKTATRREVEALTGWGAGEASDLVALANAPAAVAGPVQASMAAGITPWRLARRFFRELGHRAHEDAADVAASLFGDDPDAACTDRLDPDGDLKDGPWEHKLFYRALAAESTRLDSADAQAAAQARARARARRDVRCTVDADGTGSVRVGGTAAQVAAVADRVERAARAARAAGDGRTLAQLRADIAMSLLMHSTLDLPQTPERSGEPAGSGEPGEPGGCGGEGLPGLVRTAWSEQMRAVMLALPRAVLNVIVPFDALVHSPARPVLAPGPGSGPGGACPTCGGPPAPGAAFRPPPVRPPGTDPGHPPGTDPDPPVTNADHPPAGADTDHPAGAVPDRPAGTGAPPGAGTGSVGMVTGAFPFFLTADAVRELALSPGTTLHRLLTDPADGRCVERSIASYAPDAAMRAQVHAADVTCRAPGCVQHAPYTQLDHVLAHSAGGPTSEANLQDLHSGHHDPKTRGEWTAVMAANRDVTWTSLLGRIYRTRAHDYRQYSTLLRRALDRVEGDTQAALEADRAAREAARAQGTNGSGGVDGRGEPREQLPLTRERAHAEAVDSAIYRALTYRPPAHALRAGDDHPDTDTHPYYLGWDLVDLTHTTHTGPARTGPDPDTAEAEEQDHHDTRPSTPDTHHHSTDEDDSNGDSDGHGDSDGENHTARTARTAPDDEPPPF